MRDVDAIVIGAGHNGLASAIHLAAKGWSVAVFERSSEAGGAIRSAQIVGEGFVSDLAAMNLSLFAGSAFHASYGDDLARHGLEFVPAAHPFASVFDDGTWLGVSTDLETTAARISRFSQDDAETWKRMAGAFPGEAELIGGLLSTPMTRRAMTAFGWKAWRKMGFGWMIEKLRFLASSPRAFLDENFENPKLKAMMAAWGMHLDFAPEIAGGAVFPYLESMANQSFGMVIGKGGADTMIRAMTRLLEEKGGRLHLEGEVVEVMRGGSGATGVRLADGSEVKAGRAVIASTTPQALVEKLLDGASGDESYDRRAGNFRYAPGTMMIHLALDGLPDWSAGQELKDFAYIHIAPTLDMMDLAYAQAKAGLLPAEPVIVCGQPTSIDPSRTPEGKHILWLQVRMVPAEIRGDAAGEIEGTDWEEVKQAYADRVLAIIERHAPGLRDLIIDREVVSPLDLQAMNPNLVGGDQISGSHHLSQNFLFRPVAGHADWSTPVGNLHLIGASSWPGAGTGAGSGFMLARRLAGG